MVTKWKTWQGGINQEFGINIQCTTIYKKYIVYTSLVAQRLKRLPGMQETRLRSLGQEDPLEKEMATTGTLAWRTPWTEETVGCSPWGCKESDTTELPFSHPFLYRD